MATKVRTTPWSLAEVDLQAKGDKDGEVVRKAEQDLLMELVRIKTTNQVQGQPKQQKSAACLETASPY